MRSISGIYSCFATINKTISAVVCTDGGGVLGAFKKYRRWDECIAGESGLIIVWSLPTTRPVIIEKHRVPRVGGSERSVGHAYVAPPEDAIERPFGWCHPPTHTHTP